MKTILFIFLFALVAEARQFSSVQVVNMIDDDEGTKVIAELKSKKPVVLYLSQSNAQFETLNQKLQKAQQEKKSVKIETSNGELNLIVHVEEKK